MAKYIFILHPKSTTGNYNYSLIPEDKVKIVPEEAIFKTQEVESKEYTKEELEEICNKLISQL